MTFNIKYEEPQHTKNKIKILKIIQIYFRVFIFSNKP